MTEVNKPALLIFNDQFYPAYKAGGPVQSLTNLALALQHEYAVSIVAGAYDLNDDHMLDDVKPGQWSEVILPRSSSSLHVWYAGKGEPRSATIKKIIGDVKPAIVYLNGMFSFRYVMLPLFNTKKIKIVICPRGMLQKGALAGKALKKKIYLAALRMSGIMNNVSWHATNEEEQEDIIREFGKHSNVFVAGNIPKKPVSHVSRLSKKAGELRLVYLSLISEKKNLLQTIDLVSQAREKISLHIYGPVKDEGYWKKCMEAIDKSDGKVEYRGNVLPEKVQDIFSGYHASVLLTKGENFGHALYESLSAGRPVITSYFTPWNGLLAKNAGWNVDISDEKSIINTISEICNLDERSYDLFYDGAFRLANDYYLKGFDIDNYRKMFS